MAISLTFVAKKLVSIALTPPVLPLLLLFCGLVLWSRKPRIGKPLAWTGFVLALLLSAPYPVNLLVTPLECYPAVKPDQLKTAQAIVILAGGQRRINEEYDNAPSVSHYTLERIRYGAWLAHKTSLPILVTGGAPTGWKAESVLMQESLLVDFHTDVRWVETRSLDTADNARYSALILKQAGIKRIALVSHAAHLRRAVAEFEAVGLEVIPAPMGFMSQGPAGEEFFDLIPGNTSTNTGWYAAHEWLGILAQKIRFALKGRLG